MPLPPLVAPPYDTLETVLNTVRTRMNDAMGSLAGEILTDAQPFMQQYANTGWRKMQEFLANLGFSRLTQEIVLFGLPPVTNLDPASQVMLNWSNYFDGTEYYAPPLAPLLPQNLILPLKLWERQSGMNACFPDDPMTYYLDGLPALPKTGLNYVWEWREDSIYMPGATLTTDLRVRFAGFLQDFITAGGIQWQNQPVPIMRCREALANFICFEAALPRGAESAAVFQTAGEEAAKRLFNREVALKQRVNIRRIPRSGNLRSGNFSY